MSASRLFGVGGGPIAARMNTRFPCFLTVALLLALPAAAETKKKAAAPAHPARRSWPQGRSASSTTGRRQRNTESGQTVCYAFTRAQSSAPPLPGRGAVVLTVTERSSGRDAVAIEAGFAYAANATVTLQVDQAGLEFYTSGRKRIRPGRQGGGHRVRKGHPSDRQVAGPQGGDGHLQPEGVLGPRTLPLPRRAPRSDRTPRDDWPVRSRSREGPGEIGRCSTHRRSCWRTGDEIWLGWTGRNWPRRWRRLASQRSESSNCGTGSIIRGSPNSPACPRLRNHCRVGWPRGLSSDDRKRPSCRPAWIRHGKWLFRFRDGQEAETVYIPDPVEDRGAVCISSQVGCTLSCRFCHTGTQTLVRNLGAPEIVGQFMAARDSYGEWPSPKGETPRLLSTIVLMGMGEPLYNYVNVAKAMKIAMDGEGDRSVASSDHAVHVRRGVPMMDRAGAELGVNLVGVAACGDRRVAGSDRVPLNRKYPIAEVLAACRRYPGSSNARRITFEYIMLKGCKRLRGRGA